MPFEILQTETRPIKTVKATIGYRKARLFIGIPKTIVKDFKPKADQLFGFMMGSGDDQGKARIVPAKAGAKATMLKGSVSFRFGFVPMLGTDAAEKEYVDVCEVDGGFEITLPPWFHAE